MEFNHTKNSTQSSSKPGVYLMETQRYGNIVGKQSVAQLEADAQSAQQRVTNGFI